MYATKSSAKSGADEKHKHLWEMYRPTNTINFSDIVEDRTIYDQTRSEMTFDSGEMNVANEAEIDPDSVSVDDILGNSIVHEIRHLSQSRQGAMSTSIRDSFSYKPSASQFNIGSNDFSCASVDFRPAEELVDQLAKDEHAWEQEFAPIPQMECKDFSMATADTSRKPSLPPKFHGKLTSLTDFSVAYLADSISGNTDISIGRFFQNRCGDLRDMIPENSPKKFKDHVPMALVEKPAESVLGDAAGCETNSQATSSFFADDESNMRTPKISTSTYDKEGSIIRLSNVNNFDDVESPRTFLNKLYANKSKPLTKANVRKLENTLNSETSAVMVSRMASKPNQDYQEFEQYEHPKKDMDGMLNRMNSTKIEEKEEKENQWRNSIHSSADTASANELTMTESNYSSMEKRLPCKDNGNVSKIKRLASSKPYELALNCSANTRPAANVSPLTEEQRRFVLQTPSPDRSKFSLPSYGLHGAHANQHDAVPVDKRCNSQLSTHSEFTQQDGKFPLKSNSSELVWECVKLRKSIKKSFVIKNTSEKRLSLKIDVYGPGFQIAPRPESDSLVLQGNECRTISVTFCPTVVGKAIGKVVFRPTKHWPEDTQRSVFLWAYGGNTDLQLQGVERGPVGCSFLKLADTSNITSTMLQRTFSIYNRGPLNGVATVFVKPKTDQYINENNIVIEPSKCVIRANSSTTINVTYKLRRRDLEKLRDKNCEVLTVGTLEVIYGAEPNRQRIASMLTRKGDIPSMYKQLQFLVDDFPVASLEQFRDFREHIDNVSDLFGCFKTSEIALTINRTNLDESRDNDLTMEDSVMFRSMIETPKQNVDCSNKKRN